MTFPSPETVDVLAEVCEEQIPDFLRGDVEIMRSLMAYAGSPSATPHISRDDERVAMVRLAAHAVARIELIDKDKN